MGDVRERIRKLIRTANDQKGKPEGNNALRLARKLIAKHGLEDEFIRKPGNKNTNNPEFDRKLDQIIDGLKDLFNVK